MTEARESSREGRRTQAYSHIGLSLAVLLASGFFNFAAAACDFKTSDYLEGLGNLNSVRSLEIENKNYRKWVKNGISIIKSDSLVISPRQKRKFKARVIVNYDFGQCVHNADIRQNGDWKDHVAFQMGQLAQSVDVRLRDGNIAGIVRFKLFLKETRYGENEIFGALLLRKLGFLAPKTRMMHVKQNNLSLEMLFQEKAAKEFLEAQGRREGPIFESDERLMWAARIEGRELLDLGLARMVNQNWAGRGPTSLGIALNAFTKLQNAYVQFANRVSSGAELGLVIDLPHSSEANARRFAEYEALLMAMNGAHALIVHNRKYYWNVFLGAFEPIFYDGNFEFGPLDEGAQVVLGGDAAILAKKFDAVVLAKVKTDVSNALDDAFAAEFAEATGFSLLDARKTVARIAGIFASNIDNLPRYLNGLVTAEGPHLETQSAEAARAELIRRHLDIFPEAAFLDIDRIDGSDGTVSVTCLPAPNCDIETLSLTEIADILESSETEENSSVVLLPTERNNDRSDQSFTVLDQLGIRVTHAVGASVSFDPATRVVSLMQSRADDWFLFLGQDLDGIRIIMDGITPASGGAEARQRFNEFGLTGCVNIVNSTLRNLSISVANGACEDSLNVVSSTGHIAEIRIRNGFADAVDLDFSRLTVTQANIEAAGNDCFDVSSGTYDLVDAQFLECGDKGLSVGERSVVNAQSVSVASALIGVSSKDSSRVTIDDAKMTEVPTCLEAYRKKQEFDGAVLSVAAIFCPDGANVLDDASTIELGGV